MTPAASGSPSNVTFPETGIPSPHPIKVVKTNRSKLRKRARSMTIHRKGCEQLDGREETQALFTGKCFRFAAITSHQSFQDIRARIRGHKVNGGISHHKICASGVIAAERPQFVKTVD